MNFDSTRMTHAWAILTDQSNPEHWEPDRYNAAAFVKVLLDKYEELDPYQKHIEREQNENT